MNCNRICETLLSALTAAHFVAFFAVMASDSVLTKDDAETLSKKRVSYSLEQKRLLEEVFVTSPYPSAAVLSSLTRAINVPVASMKVSGSSLRTCFHPCLLQSKIHGH